MGPDIDGSIIANLTNYVILYSLRNFISFIIDFILNNRFDIFTNKIKFPFSVSQYFTT